MEQSTVENRTKEKQNTTENRGNQIRQLEHMKNIKTEQIQYNRRQYNVKKVQKQNIIRINSKLNQIKQFIKTNFQKV